MTDFTNGTDAAGGGTEFTEFSELEGTPEGTPEGTISGGAWYTKTWGIALIVTSVLALIGLVVYMLTNDSSPIKATVTNTTNAVKATIAASKASRAASNSAKAEAEAKAAAAQLAAAQKRLDALLATAGTSDAATKAARDALAKAERDAASTKAAALKATADAKAAAEEAARIKAEGERVKREAAAKKAEKARIEAERKAVKKAEEAREKAEKAKRDAEKAKADADKKSPPTPKPTPPKPTPPKPTPPKPTPPKPTPPKPTPPKPTPGAVKPGPVLSPAADCVKRGKRWDSKLNKCMATNQSHCTAGKVWDAKAGKCMDPKSGPKPGPKPGPTPSGGDWLSALKINAKLGPKIVTFQGKKAFENTFRKGGRGPGGSDTRMELTVPGLFPAEQCRAKFSIWFMDNWPFTKTSTHKVGGKLGGFRMGTGDASGNKYSSTGASARVVFKAEQHSNGYLYPQVKGTKSNITWSHADQGSGVQKVSKIASGIHLWGLDNTSFKLHKGKWNDIELFVKLNDPGQKNGIFELSVNGQRRRLTDVRYRYDNALINSWNHSAFFGGGTMDYAPKETTKAWYTDFRFSRD